MLGSMKRIIFLHIPKTAGTSIREMFFCGAHANEIFPAHLPQDQLRYSVASLSTYRMFSGHLDWSGLDCLPGDRFVFTVLRNPVDRVISNFCFWKQIAESTTQEQLIREGLPHIAELKNYTTMSEYFFETRESVRRVVGYTFDNMYTHYFALRRFCWPSDRPAVSPQQLLENALTNLERLDFVGITEHMEKTVQRLADALDCQATPRILYLNTSRSIEGRNEVSREIDADKGLKARIEEFTYLDTQVYEIMRHRFLSDPFCTDRRVGTMFLSSAGAADIDDRRTPASTLSR